MAAKTDRERIDRLEQIVHGQQSVLRSLTRSQKDLLGCLAKLAAVVQLQDEQLKLLAKGSGTLPRGTTEAKELAEALSAAVVVRQELKEKQPS